MANLKEVRERINSVISTQQITKAMKMVAASKLRRAQQAITQLRPYANKLQAMLSNILANADEDDDQNKFGVQRPLQNGLIVLITSNRGLCGGFNSSLLKMVTHLIETKYANLRKVGKLSILCIGKKGNDFIKKRYTDVNLISDFVELVTKDFSYSHSEPISSALMADFEQAKYDAVDIVYSQFKNAATQSFVVEPFLPVAKSAKKEGEMSADFLFEPNQSEILTYLVPTILKTQFYKTIIDTTASEHGARMTAMEKASENAEELLKGLKISYNKARQENITKELTEIIGGVAALEGA
jgi:F-type H+-transporting ATPase subunit gamma